MTSCPILSLFSYHTTGTTTRALTKRGGRKRYLNGKSDRKDAKVGGIGWEENRCEEILRCTNWSSNNDWPPLGLSIHPDKMSGPLLPDCNGWLACLAWERAPVVRNWKPLESIPAPVSSLSLFPLTCPLSHTLNPGQLVTQPHTTYTQTKHIRLWVWNWHQTCVVCVKK